MAYNELDNKLQNNLGTTQIKNILPLQSPVLKLSTVFESMSDLNMLK